MLSNRGMQSDINITPLIDVLLVLVIIFLLLTHRSVIQAQLAREESGTVDEKIDNIVLELHDDGQYTINTQVVGHAELEARLREVFAPRAQKVLFIRSGPSRTYAEAIAMMDVAKSAGVEVVALAPQ